MVTEPLDSLSILTALNDCHGGIHWRYRGLCWGGTLPLPARQTIVQSTLLVEDSVCDLLRYLPSLSRTLLLGDSAPPLQTFVQFAKLPQEHPGNVEFCTLLPGFILFLIFL